MDLLQFFASLLGLNTQAAPASQPAIPETVYLPAAARGALPVRAGALPAARARSQFRDGGAGLSQINPASRTPAGLPVNTELPAWLQDAPGFTGVNWADIFADFFSPIVNVLDGPVAGRPKAPTGPAVRGNDAFLPDGSTPWIKGTPGYDPDNVNSGGSATAPIQWRFGNDAIGGNQIVKGQPGYNPDFINSGPLTPRDVASTRPNDAFGGDTKAGYFAANPPVVGGINVTPSTGGNGNPTTDILLPGTFGGDTNTYTTGLVGGSTMGSF